MARVVESIMYEHSLVDYVFNTQPAFEMSTVLHLPAGSISFFSLLFFFSSFLLLYFRWMRLTTGFIQFRNDKTYVAVPFQARKLKPSRYLVKQ